jgi:hypothetical protein
MSHELDWQDGANDYPTSGPAPIAGEHDDLEAGIAAVFEAIRNNGGGFDAEADSEAAFDSAIDDDGATFELLGELNRLWQQAPH